MYCACRAEQQQLLLSRAPLPAHGSRQLREDAEAVSAMLEDAGFQTLPLDLTTAAATADTEAAQAHDPAHASRQSAGSAASATAKHALAAPVGSPAGPGRLEQFKGRILEQQQQAAAAAASARAEAAARAAAEAAAKKKPYK